MAEWLLLLLLFAPTLPNCSKLLRAALLVLFAAARPMLAIHEAAADSLLPVAATPAPAPAADDDVEVDRLLLANGPFVSTSVILAGRVNGGRGGGEVGFVFGC